MPQLTTLNLHEEIYNDYGTIQRQYAKKDQTLGQVLGNNFELGIQTGRTITVIDEDHTFTGTTGSVSNVRTYTIQSGELIRTITEGGWYKKVYKIALDEDDKTFDTVEIESVVAPYVAVDPDLEWRREDDEIVFTFWTRHANIDCVASVTIKYNEYSYSTSYDFITLSALDTLEKAIGKRLLIIRSGDSAEFTLDDKVEDFGYGQTDFRLAIAYNYNSQARLYNGEWLSCEIIRRFDYKFSHTLEIVPLGTINVGQSLKDIFDNCKYIVDGEEFLSEEFFEGILSLDNDITFSAFYYPDASLPFKEYIYQNETIIIGRLTPEDYLFEIVKSLHFNISTTIATTLADGITPISVSVGANFTFLINGIERVSIEPIDLYQSDTKTLDINNFAIKFYNANGIEEYRALDPDNLRAEYMGDIVRQGEELESGKWTVYYKYYNTDESFVEGSCELFVYEESSKVVTAEITKPYAIVGQYLYPADINVNAQFTVDGYLEPYNIQISDFTYSPTARLTTIGMQDITITALGETITKQLQVIGKANNVAYVFDKVSPFKGEILGDIQEDYSIGLTLNSHKDSCKVLIYSRSYIDEIKPNTIVYLESTDTWWVVRQDKCSRSENEQTSLWKHDLDLVGAIDILSNRDLTDCGFKKNRYNVKSYLTRLIKMSDFEIPTSFDLTLIDESENVPYTKAYENYTPLSAIRTFLDGINAEAKMTFKKNNENEITKAIIKVYPKNGFGEIIDIEEFNQIDEEKFSNKTNYGTRVVSNAQNLIANNEIRYPSQGFMHLDSDEETINSGNAYFKLPTNAYDVKSIELSGSKVAVKLYTLQDGEFKEVATVVANGDSYNSATLEELYNEIMYQMTTWRNVKFIQRDIDAFAKIKDNFKNSCKSKLVKKINSGDICNWNYNGLKIIADSLISLKPISSMVDTITMVNKKTFGFGDENFVKSGLVEESVSMYWAQGTNKINNFKILGNQYWAADDYSKELEVSQDDRDIANVVFHDPVNTASHYFQGFKIAASHIVIRTHNLGVAVNYVPMQNVKLKKENKLEENDSHIFNQNGKLNDGLVIEKILHSQAKQVSSNEITRNRMYYNYFDIPSPGSIVINRHYIEKLSSQIYRTPYIEFDGTNYINLGIQALSVKMEVSVALTHLGQTGVKFGTSRFTTNALDDIEDTNYHDITITPRVDTQEIFVGAMNDNGVATNHGKCRIKHILLTRGVTKIAEFVPCYNEENNKAGLFDLVSRTFITGSNIMLQEDRYIINNVSIDMACREGNASCCNAEISMSLDQAVKSLMVSGDKSIRDYDIPQQSKVQRKQMYRDYIELDYVLSHKETPFLQNLGMIFNFGNQKYGDTQGKMGFIKLLNADSQATFLYYQKNVVKMQFGKTLINILDFGDNAIIGYAKDKIDGFTWHLPTFFNSTKLRQIPIHYCDGEGELSYLEVMVLESDKYINALESTLSQAEKQSISAASVVPFIASEPYDYAKSHEKDYLVTESSYNKDGTEIPYFEFTIELNDNNGIEITDNFLESEDISVPTLATGTISSPSSEYEDDVNINLQTYFVYKYAISDNKITQATKPQKVCNLSFEEATREIEIGLQQDEEPFGKNIAIYRCKIENGVQVATTHLLTINNCKTANSEIKLYVNNYKLR